ncbi:hypothetical protein SLS62_010560 [Diatrype stigma]|uniref:Ubiquitin-like domain-containing protein n=1 Tax=Diatrype stigma TaxID=117547 RepID=A0AAN9UAT9_9PEZI
MSATTHPPKPPLGPRHPTTDGEKQPPQPPPQPQPQEQPLLLTIRFSAALPDLELDIPHPSRTTVVSLKHLIRTRLSEPNSQRRLRFIHGGKILPDGAVLSAVLKPPPPPPPPSAPAHTASAASRYIQGLGLDRVGRGDGDASGAGRGAGGGGGGGSASSSGKGKAIPGRPRQRIYVNCSIGDSLTSTELSDEAAAAAAPPSPSASAMTTSSSSYSYAAARSSYNYLNPPTASPTTTTTTTTATTTTPAPRGFDRLLTAGFTPAEVNQLRLQFRSIHASRYTPDTLPSPDSFRGMEDAWIDSSTSASLAGTTPGGGGGGFGDAADETVLAAAGGGGAGGGAGGSGSGIAGTIDVLVRGVVTGFLWPLGSGAWLMREEGMHSGRSRFMVGVGVLFSILVGVIRAISGER